MNYLSVLKIICVVIPFNSFVKAQNLLANSDFRDVNTCIEMDAPCAPEAWLLASPRVPVYKNDQVLIVVHNSGKRNVRQYLQTQLLQGLKAGQKYQFSIRVKAGKCVVNSFGIKFSEEFTCVKNDELIENPDIDLSTQLEKIRERKQRKWMEFSIEYTARGDEKFILIGCFDSFKNQERNFKKKPEPFKNFYYYIDRVQLIDKNIDSLPESAIRAQKHLYEYNHRHTYCNYLPYEEPESQNIHSEVGDSIPQRKLNKKQPDTIVFGDVLFDFNSSKLNQDATEMIKEKLDQVVLNKVSSIKIVGFTDNIGSEDYNKNLSKDRAESVKEYLISIDLAAEMISTDGLGSQNPVADNTSEEGRAQNRRIEILFHYE